jgi:DNA helicase-2/ATP-dependent DNA helicase PcrA
VAALIDWGVDPERILLLMFTRRGGRRDADPAAAICRRRDAARKLWGGTFHAVAYRLVAAHAESLGQATSLSVLDQADARDLMDLLRHEHGLTGSAQRFPTGDALLDIYSRSVNTGQPARDLITAMFPWCEPHRPSGAQLPGLEASTGRPCGGPPCHRPRRGYGGDGSIHPRRHLHR